MIAIKSMTDFSERHCVCNNADSFGPLYLIYKHAHGLP